MRLKLLNFVVIFTAFTSSLLAQTPAVKLIKEGFIYETAPFPECHASSIVELGKDHLMATWFGGTHERHPDVCIWTSESKNGKWSAPKKMADGVMDENENTPTFANRYERAQYGGVPLPCAYRGY